ncbi:acyl-homoserine-lactone synthase [Bosea sp. CCNWLW174]|uniref:acyl-homoserine-lactone synthase n=1 Tax=unclassified Bosea (in: a-proteobacteria) TaxID=2653178 RepID=UPI003014660B
MVVQIQVVTWADRKKFRLKLERYFRIRYDIYVRRRQWRALARPINIEMDAFDTEHAVYLLALDSLGKIVGGSRLVPTLQPHLLGNVFPELAPAGPPRAPDIFEWTRFFISPALHRGGRSPPVAGILLCGVLEVAHKLGIRQISVVCETFWPKRLRAFGWSITELGKVLQHEDGDVIALLIDVTPEAIANTRRVYGIREPILAEAATTA